LDFFEKYFFYKLTTMKSINRQIIEVGIRGKLMIFIVYEKLNEINDL